MANIKVSELELKSTNLQTKDLLLVSEFQSSDGTFTSKAMDGTTVFESIKTSMPFATFLNTHGQATIADTPTAMTFDTTTITPYNVGLIEETKIQVFETGVYNIQFSAQIYRLSGGTNQHIDIWFRVNGTDIDNSNTRMTVANNGHYLVASWNLFTPMNSDDYIEIMWAVSNDQIILQSETIGTIHPATPSIIATINRIN
jgi:hypothetical protein